jgi:hypothetical protein
MYAASDQRLVQIPLRKVIGVGIEELGSNILHDRKLKYSPLSRVQMHGGVNSVVKATIADV